MEEVPNNENPWKIIFAYAEENLSGEDKIKLRAVCQDSKKAATEYVEFSQEKFETLLTTIDNMHLGVYQGEIDVWLDIEKKLTELMFLCRSDPVLRDQLIVWFQDFIKHSARFMPKEADISEVVQATMEQHEQNIDDKYRPSVRRGISRAVRGISAGCTVLTGIVTIPVAILALPSFFTNNSRLRGIASALVAPCVHSFSYSMDTFHELRTQPNFRNSTKHRDLQECIRRINKMLTQSLN